MKSKKVLLGFVIVAITVISLTLNLSADVQSLTYNELSSYVGACLCKSSSTPSAECTTCTPDDGSSWRCRGGGPYTKRICVTGTPDGCDPDGSSLKCDSVKWVWDGNEDCDGDYEIETTDCYKDTAKGELCD